MLLTIIVKQNQILFFFNGKQNYKANKQIINSTSKYFEKREEMRSKGHKKWKFIEAEQLMIMVWIENQKIRNETNIICKSTLYPFNTWDQMNFFYTVWVNRKKGKYNNLNKIYDGLKQH